ncbi:MAG: hypothetical protein SVY15_07865 [Halobacteriota archaeon]|nr:hypothetical protein [Halobacteriota archaeon]
MAIKARRSNFKTSKFSHAMIIPAGLKIGNKSTIAADRLMLVDPRGEITEDVLLEFFETFIEPKFWEWYDEEK